MAIRYPVVPKNITVHLGKPSDNSQNVTVSFMDYISNVACSEIYPTWPKEALKANIYTIISFTMNRVYNEWYRSKGYNFDITNSTAYDQAFILNRSTYENINNIVEEIFNNYIVKGNGIEPYFTTYCDGRNTTCSGLSQWGSVSLANSGKSYLEILKYYYGNDISIKYDAEVGDVVGYPGYVVGLGSAGNPVLAIQRDLRRIRKNYPAIPNITNTLGIYDEETRNAVKKFQEIFSLPVTGSVDKATWYKIKYIYTSVKKLSDLYSEGLTREEATFLYEDELNYGDTGIEVEHIHYFLDAIAFLDPDIPRLPTNSIYNDNSIAMVKAFQKKYNLPVTGVFTYRDWNKLKEIYDKILKNLSNEFVSDLYPDNFLSIGSSGEDVLKFQRYLLTICRYDHSIPGVRVNGVFDDLTRKSVLKLQRDFGLEENGIVGPILWKRVVELSKRN